MRTSVTGRAALLLVLVTLTVLISGCGQKGDLFLPEEELRKKEAKR